MAYDGSQDKIIYRTDVGYQHKDLLLTTDCDNGQTIESGLSVRVLTTEVFIECDNPYSVSDKPLIKMFASNDPNSEIVFDFYSWIFSSCAPSAFHLYFMGMDPDPKLTIDNTTDAKPIFIIDSSEAYESEHVNFNYQAELKATADTTAISLTYTKELSSTIKFIVCSPTVNILFLFPESEHYFNIEEGKAHELHLSQLG